MCSKLFCFLLFTNLIQIKEKMQVPVTVRFPDYGLMMGEVSLQA